MKRSLIGAFLSLLFGLSLASGPAAAQTTAAQAPEDWAEWLAAFRTEAAGKGIKETTLAAALNGIQPVDSILKRDRKQAEFTLTFPQYRDKVVSQAKIDRGREMADKHAALLAQISQKYGVQSRFILAIWGVESFFGTYTGKDPVVESLATLAYDRRRSSFFRKQLIASLQMVDRGYIELENMKGSWAGAMGQPQFIPTSYLAYAVDEDGDGRRDIWTSEADIFGSIANYLAKHGWSPDQTWGRAVQVPKSLRQQWSSIAKKHESMDRSLAEWAKAGVRRADGSPLPVANLPTRLVAPDGSGGPVFAAYPNYRRILRYNSSHFYALAIGTLSDRIEYR
ncbi:MAG: lytic murein transglycosylase [Alphaproteobacteria bacterium]|jgi:membrane-bound lytic murein transglycosylase B